MPLKYYRMRAGWTQADLAERSGVRQDTISRIEAGRVKNPSHRTAMALCRALGVDPALVTEFSNGGRL